MITLRKQIDLFNKESYLPIQALSWKNPFGSAMLYGKKETRSWPTKHRGEVLICLSKSGYNLKELEEMCHSSQIDSLADIIAQEGDRTGFLGGVAIAVGILVNCRPMMPEDEDQCFVKFSNGLWVHEYKSVSRIEPFEFTGSQKFTNVTDQSILSQIKFT